MTFRALLDAARALCDARAAASGEAWEAKQRLMAAIKAAEAAGLAEATVPVRFGDLYCWIESAPSRPAPLSRRIWVWEDRVPYGRAAWVVALLPPLVAGPLRVVDERTVRIGEQYELTGTSLDDVALRRLPAAPGGGP